jgi:diadenosine tetraphosphate (Ap4A) HIT family hydrolase
VNLGDFQTAACFICQKHRGAIALPGGALYEDQLVYAGHVRADQGPVYLRHLMAELKRHAPELAEQTSEEAQALGLLVARLSRALKASEEAEHIYLFVIGDQVPHLHLYLFHAIQKPLRPIGVPGLLNGQMRLAVGRLRSLRCASVYAPGWQLNLILLERKQGRTHHGCSLSFMTSMKRHGAHIVGDGRSGLVYWLLGISVL